MHFFSGKIENFGNLMTVKCQACVEAKAENWWVVAAVHDYRVCVFDVF